MTEAIWNDLLVRLKNLRGDMVGQWQGDLDNRQIAQAITLLGHTIEMWEQAKPILTP